MELRQLEYLVAVVEEANFTRAAARVHVAQPGVSAQVRHLESELGQELLHRSGRGVTVTQAGAAVLPYARAALAAVAGAREAVDQLAGLVRGRITIGTVTSMSSESFDLAGLLATFHHDHPHVEITLTAGNSDELAQALHDGRIDLAIVGLGSTNPPGLNLHVITEEPLVAAVPHTHPLACKRALTFAALARYPVICLPAGTGLRACLDEACHEARVTLRVQFEAGDPRMLAQLAAEGLGIAIVPRSITDARSDQLSALTITRPMLHGRLAFAWRTQGPLGPAATHLLHRALASGAEIGRTPVPRGRPGAPLGGG